MAAPKNVMHMNGGDTQTSYASNSNLQKVVISKTLHVLDETLEDMLSDNVGLPKCFKMVDMGCASGANTLLATSYIINKIRDLCKQKDINELPEFEVFLNDLPDNDFNNLFKSLPERDYFVHGLPGSFYGRLLPKKSLNFAYSSYSTHWLSQVPEGLENKNKENIYIAMTSPPEVYNLYAKQYQRDFCRFLSLRAEEIKSGGHMVLTFVGRSVEDPSTKDDFATFRLLANALEDMVDEGLVKKDALYSFNIPIYAPCTQEVEAAIQSEGSFALDKMKYFGVHRNDDPVEDEFVVKKVAHNFRAFMEPMVASHFGRSITDDIFGRFTNKLTEHLSVDGNLSFNIVISLSRK